VRFAPRHRLRGAALLALAMAAACTEDQRAIDPFPIRVDLTHGPVALAIDGGDGPAPAVIDTATPLTVLDPYETGERVPAASRRSVTVTLFGLDESGQATIPRARFPDTIALVVHPCPDDALCSTGLDGDAFEFKAILGADILSRTAARFDFPSSQLNFFPDTSGTSAQLGNECHAVIGQAFAGGGTLDVGDTQVNYGGWRPIVGACLDESRSPTEERGTDALLMLSTGIGVSVLAAGAYQRYAEATGAPTIEELPSGVLHLPSGPAEVKIGRVGTIALVGSLGNRNEDQADRGPCRELFLNRSMSDRQCEPPDPLPPSPCPDGARFCSTAAAVDLDRSIEVAVLDDTNSVLQALRDELRPEAPELDGLLGTDALASLRLELDYFNNRMLMRCEEGGCRTLPAVRSEAAAARLCRCRDRDAGLPDAAPDGADAGADGGPADGGTDAAP
jgi:hypothetical protein